MDFDLAREIRLPSLRATARADSEGQQWSVALGAGASFAFGAWSLGPHLRMEYLDVEIDGYTERGAGALDFRVDGQAARNLRSELGVDVSYALSTSIGIVMPYARADWVHEWEDDARNVGISFVANPARTRFFLRTSGPDRDWIELALGATLTLVEARSLFLEFESPLGLQDRQRYSITGGVRLQF